MSIMVWKILRKLPKPLLLLLSLLLLAATARALPPPSAASLSDEGPVPKVIGRTLPFGNP